MNLTFTLATTDFKLRYFGSALGYLWSLMRPLLFFGVLLRRLHPDLLTSARASRTTPCTC